MGRDLFRGFIKMALLICLVVSCVEAFYFMSELSKRSSTNKHNYHYSSSRGYYNRNGTVDYTDDIEEIDDYEQDTTRAYTQQEYEY